MQNFPGFRVGSGSKWKKSPHRGQKWEKSHDCDSSQSVDFLGSTCSQVKVIVMTAGVRYVVKS